MSVVPFRRVSRRTEQGDPLAPIADLVAAIHALGEPATADEILAFLYGPAGIAMEAPEIALLTLLEVYSGQGFKGLSDAPIFRVVSLGGARAWALTPTFRDVLRGRGIHPRLRAGS